MDTPLFAQKNDIWGRCLGLLDTVQKQSGVLTLLWHHAVFNEREYPGWIGLYETIIKESQARNGWIASGKEISDWWRRRDSANLTARAHPACWCHDK